MKKIKKIKPGSLLRSEELKVFVLVKYRIYRTAIVIHYPDGVDDMCTDNEVRMRGQKYDPDTHLYTLIQEPS